jgi:chromosome segregation ATPase
MTDEFERGKVAGQVQEHDRRLNALNGSLHSIDQRLENIELKQQHIIDTMVSDRTTLVTTAQALKDANNLRREKSEAQYEASDRKWNMPSKVFATIGFIILLVGFLLDTFEVHIHLF